MRRFPLLAVPALVASLLHAAGCLITQAPQFREPPVTAPFLVPGAATPPASEVVVVDLSTMPVTAISVTFSAPVISEDDQPDSPGPDAQIEANLLIDYGMTAADGKPYRPPLILGNTLDAGMLDETMGRMATALWTQVDHLLEPGCHTATLMVSHQWTNPAVCPVCADDIGSITWLLFLCDGTVPAGMPNSCHDFDPTMCPLDNRSSVANDCPTYMKAQDAGGTCPAIEGVTSP
jgi:hypothetical protein